MANWLSKLPEEFKSRKLLTWALASGLVLLSGLFSADKINAIVMGILGCLTIYHGGNVSAGWIDATHGPQSANVIAAKSTVATTTTETVNPPKAVTTTTQKAADKPIVPPEEEGA